MTLVLPQVTPLFPRDNDAVRLWDNNPTPLNPPLTTKLTSSHPTSNTSVIPATGTLSFWINPRVSAYLGGAGSLNSFVLNTWQQSSDARGAALTVSGGGNVNLSFSDVSGNTVLSFSQGGLGADAWGHVLVNWNTTSGPRVGRFVINDAVASQASDSNANTFFQRTPFTINGQFNDNQSQGAIELYDLWMTDTILDVSDVAVRRKFIDASGNPVPLGSRGQRPTGSIPLVFFSGELNGWRRNKGTILLPELTIQNSANYGKASTKPS